ncbi:hypothetical protein QYE76_064119 [Lolium multiflorum]|uniref:Uncharacterized protein n=1 Tax=Lolium multiflorum TaxID=4521 RepID=A0AAD8S6V7_LOLMU|nr:hypothetical protein QYE76_064119 [Lolium multiflorum]
MKKPSTLLRSISTRLSTRLAPSPSPAVAPWPPVRSAYDRWLAAELDELHADPLAPCTSAAWLGRAIGLAVAAQRRLVAESELATTAGIDRKTVDECVEDTAELLDACAGLRCRLDLIRSYASSMRIALHWLEGCGGGEATARRHAAAAFAECEAVERRCGAELAKCGSNLRKLGERVLQTKPHSGGRAQCEESLAGARAAALLAVGALGVALAFRPRRSVPSIVHAAGSVKDGAAAPWECELQEVQKHVKEVYERRRKEGVPCMAELEAAATDGRAVKSALTTGGRHFPEAAVAAARRRCDELEENVFVLEESIDELHRELIGVRMVLLEWSQRERGHEVLRL